MVLFALHKNSIVPSIVHFLVEQLKTRPC